MVAAGLTPGMVVTGERSEVCSGGAAGSDGEFSDTPVVLTATYGGVSRSFSIAYGDGPRFPHLERIAGRPDTLEALFTPLK